MMTSTMPSMMEQCGVVSLHPNVNPNRVLPRSNQMKSWKAKYLSLVIRFLAIRKRRWNSKS
jgi:hypothetical protein